MPETNTVDEIVEEIKTLPPEQQEQLRETLNMCVALFLMGMAATMIIEKTLTLMPDDMRRLRDVLNTLTLDIPDSEGMERMARSVRGKYAHLPTGSEAFAARKAEEIRLEDRRSRP